MKLFSSLFLLFLVNLIMCFVVLDFKSEQLRYAHVREAYEEKEETVKSLLKKYNIAPNQLEVYIRVFKHEKELEVWGKNRSDKTFKKLKTYAVCRTSGKLGPKRRKGDYQIPEGYYHISLFNPSSSYYLSLGLNYPNQSDIILGAKGNLGGDIFIHGSCLTIGCVPITDDFIKELYVLCVEAKSSGQRNIPVTVFPTHLSDKNYASLKEYHGSDLDKMGLWQDLKKGYDVFEEKRALPHITFLPSGRHKVR